MVDNLEDLIKELEKQDFDYFLDLMLDDIPDDIDKREGSIVYDAIAPCAMVQAERSLDMINYLKQSHIQTATGEFLDYFANDKGTVRETATHAKVTATIKDANNNVVTSVGIDDEFASIGSEAIMYHVININADGTVLLQADELGTGANMYTGQILPVTPNDSVNTAFITEISVPAKNAESDDDLRERLTSADSYIAYGGNVTDYKDMIYRSVTDVGAVQIYPSWNGGGTVKLVILDNNFNPASQQLMDETRNIIDPAEQSGQGYGLAPIGHMVTVATPDVLDISVNAKIVSDNKIDKETLNNNIKRNIAVYFNSLKKSWAKSEKNKYALTIYRSQIMAIILQTAHVVNAELPQLNGQANDISLTFNNQKSELPQLKEVIIDD